MTRQQQIRKLEEYGKNYKWYKYSDEQIWWMYFTIVLNKK